MGVKEVNEWANKRLKTPDGKFIANLNPMRSGSDVMFCILCCMENRIGGTSEESEEYERLVDVACEFLTSHPNQKEANELKERIDQDEEIMGEMSRHRGATPASIDMLRRCREKVLGVIS